jgi:hypothetical protein
MKLTLPTLYKNKINSICGGSFRGPEAKIAIVYPVTKKVASK